MTRQTQPTICIVAVVLLAWTNGTVRSDDDHANPEVATCVADELGRQWTWTDLDGTTHQLQADKTKAWAIVFINTDCPLANAYHPQLRELDKKYRSQGVPLFLVHSDPDVTIADAKQHVERYEIKTPVVLDTDQRIARMLGATVTPEAVVVNRRGNLLYRGRVDDLYPDFGKKRIRATSHDLRDAMQAVVDNKPVATPRTKAIGCHIYFETR